MKKYIKNADAVIHKLRAALLRAINHKLEVLRKKRWKKEKIVERRKAQAILTKWHKNRG